MILFTSHETLIKTFSASITKSFFAFKITSLYERSLNNKLKYCCLQLNMLALLL